MTVELRPLETAEDVAGLVAAAVAGAEPDEVIPPLDGPPGWTPERIEFCRSFLADRTGGLDNELRTAAYTIVADGEVAGMIRISRREEPGELEMGMWLTREFRGRGLAVVAVRLVLARAAQGGGRVMVAHTGPDNAAARATLARCGAALVERDGRIHATFDLSPAVDLV